MKKRFISLALVLLLALSCAVPALAESVKDYPVWQSNVNDLEVLDARTAPEQESYYPVFYVVGDDLLMQAVSTYHFNGGAGAEPGTIAIYQWDTGTCVGVWQAVGRSGNTWWDVFPDVVLEAGAFYHIVDSDEETWSFNSASKFEGFAELRGVSVRDGAGSRTAAVEVTVNGVPVSWTDARPFIDENNRTMVPLRAVADAMGLSVGWDGVAREASFTDGSRAIFFPIGKNEARAGLLGVIPMDTAAVIVNDRTYAPIRYLAEFFGFQVDWDGETRTVMITGAVSPG